MTKPRSTRIDIRMATQILKELDAEALKLGQTRSAIIKHLIADWLEKRRRAKD